MAAKYHITDGRIYHEAAKILHQSYGRSAEFRKGQYEAIEAVMKGKRTLVVQRTGWGKSLVYFVCAKLLRKRRKGLTMVVSPLIVLMENQREMAEKIDIKCDILNSTTRDRRSEIIDSMIYDELDLVFVTPETLFSSDIQEALPKIRVGLFVIDEAHCISDWGHDFRLEYGKLGKVIAQMPPNVAVLAVTATANDRVVNDLRHQLGDNVVVSRGKLTRESLHIDVLNLDTRAKRYAWLLENLAKLPGTGIIYCLTRADCEELSAFLRMYGLNTMPYHSGNDEYLNDEAIQKFSANKIKAIIATVKLGMGYDKGDISFVIHFQAPANIVLYYQQIGRAGRNINDAYAFLMTGGYEDESINNFFIESAFPTERESRSIYQAISDSEGIKFSEIESAVNCKEARIIKALAFLENDGLIYKEGSTYYASPRQFFYDRVRYREITRIRRQELRQMQRFAATKNCYSKFAVNCLDDPEKKTCKKCLNCTGHHVYPGLTLTQSSVNRAQAYIDSRIIKITPRRKWPDYRNIPYICQKGICLSRYGTSGFGAMVMEGRCSSGRFCDELLERAAYVLRDIVRERRVRYLAYVPSLRSDAVKNFAGRLAVKMRIDAADLLAKSEAEPQENMHNSVHKCKNAMNSFSVRRVHIPDKVILLDDVIESRWTMTVCGYKLMERGCKEVYPFALADNSEG